MKFVDEWEIDNFTDKIYRKYRTLYRKIPKNQRANYLDYGSFAVSYINKLNYRLKEQLAKEPDKYLSVTITSLIGRIVKMKNNSMNPVEIQNSIYSKFRLGDLRNIHKLLLEVAEYLDLREIIKGLVNVAIYETEMLYKDNVFPAEAFHTGFKIVRRIKHELILEDKYYHSYMDRYIKGVKMFVNNHEDLRVLEEIKEKYL